MNKKYWFYLESHIYVDFKPNMMLLYDTHTGQNLIEVSSVCINIIHMVYEDGNLGSIEISESQMANPDINNFVKQVVFFRMGSLIDSEIQPVKPVILLPILSLNLDVEKFKDKKNGLLLLARDISKYLLDVNIFLNDFCQHQCPHCRGYSKQFFCCSKADVSNSLSQESLLYLLRQISYYPVRTINITGGNIYNYENLRVFKTSNKDGRKIFNFYIHYLNYQENPDIDSQNIHIMINIPVDMNRLRDVYTFMREKEVKYHLIVEDDEQYNELESVMSEFGIKEFEIHPFYNGNNTKFFENNVYLSKDDILEIPISMREIFRNQKMNANSFGSLYIFPNGDIKANPNTETLGNLEQCTILDAINSEMLQNTAWRRIRSGKPCSNCEFQYLCPPPSNYEKIMKRMNLCNIL